MIRVCGSIQSDSLAELWPGILHFVEMDCQCCAGVGLFLLTSIIGGGSSGRNLFIRFRSEHKAALVCSVWPCLTGSHLLGKQGRLFLGNSKPVFVLLTVKAANG